MQTDQLISVIIPVYNTESYIDKCVRSFLSQTYGNIEIILVDDGSTDMSGLRCDAIAQSDSRVKVIHQSNQGVSSARNAGLDACAGEYICFADSDDYVDDDYIEYLFGLIKQYGADCAMCLNRMELADGTVLPEEELPDKPAVLDAQQMDFRDSSYMAVVTKKLYRAECLRPNGQWLRFDSELKIAEDSYFAALAVPHLRLVVKSNRRMYHYVQRDTRTTNIKDFAAAVGEIKSWYKIYGLGKTLGGRYEYSAKYELVSHCFRAHRAARPANKQEREISRRITAFMRRNAGYLMREIGYPVKLKLVFALTLVFPWLTCGLNAKR